MNIKRLFCSFLMLFCASAMSASAGVIGEVLCTDIGTLIDDSPIESYNISDYTYVVAEDLDKYGFDVIWNGDDRTLQINHNVHKGYRVSLSKDKINIKKSDIPMRKHYANVYSTDIITYLDGKPIDACNIDGRTMIQVDYLAQYGEFAYDDSRRMVEIRIMKPSFEYGLKIADDKVDTVVSFYPSKYSREVEYLGRVNENGTPYGIGRVYDSETRSETYAYWDGYTKQDTYYEERTDADGSFLRTYACSGKNGKDSYISVYGVGDDAYTMTCQKRYEFDGKCSRGGVYDKSYLYGFYVGDETYYLGDGDPINYTNGAPKKFSAVMADKRFAQIAYAKTTDGRIYAAGYSGATEDTGWDVTGLSYKVFTKTEKTDFPTAPSEPAVSDFVQYQSADAGAYNRIISLTQKGDVYFERRTGIWSELCADQSDKLDLSAPVKVFTGAEFVNVQLEDVGVVTGNAYIPYFYAVDSENNLWHWNCEYYKQPQKGNEYDENNGYIAYGRIEYIYEPVKIAENIKKAFGTEEKYFLKTDGRVVRITDGKEEVILENVADMDADIYGLNFIALKTDGTLWTWGKNQNGQCGAGHTDYVWNPMQIAEVYDRL